MKTLRLLAGAALVFSMAACNTDEGSRSQYQRETTSTATPATTPHASSAAATAAPTGAPDGAAHDHDTPEAH